MTWLRIRKVEQGDGYKIIEFPLWVPESLIRKAVDNVRRDAAVKGRRLTITVGHRLMRVEEVRDDA